MKDLLSGEYSDPLTMGGQVNSNSKEATIRNQPAQYSGRSELLFTLPLARASLTLGSLPEITSCLAIKI